MKVLILCGGRGVRAFPFTEYLPKPMLPVAGSPIIMHVIKNFISHGIQDFILAAGYRKDTLSDYFEGKNIGAKIEVLDTGESADTAERIIACKDQLGVQFIVTYADGLCDVPIPRLLDFHQSHSGMATITSVPMYSQYGVLYLNDSDKVTHLAEKPLLDDHWINAGYMVMNKNIFEHWEGKNLEQDTLPKLISDGVVFSYRHDGFFKSLDSYKDQIEFESMAKNKPYPWTTKEPVL